MVADADQVTGRHKTLTLVATIMGTAVVTVDSTVVNVALPAIEQDLGGGLAGQQWTANAYLVTLGSLLLIGGSLGDIYGERRVFSLGVVGFGITSILCAVAPTIEVLVVGRALQGVAGALLMPSALAVIVATFPESERGRAVGLWVAWSGIGTVLGPLIGGQLVDTTSWRYIFAINVPLVILTLVLIARYVPAAGPKAEDAKVDVLGATLCATGLAGFTFGLIEQPVLGWSDPAVFLPLVIGAGLFLAFLLYEARTSAPMLPLGLFRRRNFAVGNLETLCMYAGLSLLFFFLVLYLQQVAGYSALKAGLTTLPVTIVMLLLSSRFGAIADRVGPRLFMGIGPLVSAVGLALLVTLGRDVDYLTDLLPPLVIFGLGLAITVAPLTAAVLAGADAHNAGLASGVNNAIARTAGLIGIAAVGAIVAAQFGSGVDDRVAGRPLGPEASAAIEEAKRQPLAPVALAGVPAEEAGFVSEAVTDASVSGYRLAMGLSAGLVALGGMLGAIGIENPRRRVAAERCAGGQLAGQPHDAAGCDDGAIAPLPRVKVPRASAG